MQIVRLVKGAAPEFVKTRNVVQVVIHNLNHTGAGVQVVIHNPNHTIAVVQVVIHNLNHVGAVVHVVNHNPNQQRVVCVGCG